MPRKRITIEVYYQVDRLLKTIRLEESARSNPPLMMETFSAFCNAMRAGCGNVAWIYGEDGTELFDAESIQAVRLFKGDDLVHDTDAERRG